MVLPLDITKHDQHEAAFAEVLKVYGHIDMLVLNAGVDQANPAIDTTYETTEYLMNLNFLSYVALTKKVLPSMVNRKSGKVSYYNL
jgi:dehydrogenase/reductase SDR family protein 7B